MRNTWEWEAKGRDQHFANEAASSSSWDRVSVRLASEPSHRRGQAPLGWRGVGRDKPRGAGPGWAGAIVSPPCLVDAKVLGTEKCPCPPCPKDVGVQELGRDGGRPAAAAQPGAGLSLTQRRPLQLQAPTWHQRAGGGQGGGPGSGRHHGPLGHSPTHSLSLSISPFHRGGRGGPVPCPRPHGVWWQH